MKEKETCVLTQKRNCELNRKVLFEATPECNSPHAEHER